MQKISWIFFFIIALTLSCSDAYLYEQQQDFDTFTWQSDSIRTFDIDALEGSHAINYHLRYTTEYDFCNFYLSYQIISPSGKVIDTGKKLDTLFDCTTGVPLGEGMGKVYARSFTLKPSFEFAEKGTYQIRMQQLMRKDSLEGLQSVGIRIK